MLVNLDDPIWSKFPRTKYEHMNWYKLPEHNPASRIKWAARAATEAWTAAVAKGDWAAIARDLTLFRLAALDKALEL